MNRHNALKRRSSSVTRTTQWQVAKEEVEKNSLPRFNPLPCRLSGAVLLEKDLSRCRKALVWSVPDLTHATSTNQAVGIKNLESLKLTLTNKTHSNTLSLKP